MTRHFSEIFAVSALMFSAALPSAAQTQLRQSLDKAEQLRLEYRFGESARISAQALESADPSKADSLTLAGLALSRANALSGESMLGFAADPVVVARRQVPLKEFFLWYPIAEGSWCRTPNVLDPSNAFPGATYVPGNAGEIIFSAPDEGGLMKIYRTERAGGLWSAPVLADRTLVPEGNGIFPMLSPDGKSLYFSSDALHGAGGYDLYVSRWNSSERKWGEPENLGFPYSSPHNDYLFMDSPDGRYSLFASDRECPGSGDVVIYVLEFDQMPLRHAVKAEEALRLSRLMVPSSKAGAANSASAGPDAASGKYADQLRKVQALQESLTAKVGTMDRTRSSLAGLEGKARTDLEAELSRQEADLASARDQLASASHALEQIEMELISAGTMVDPQAVIGSSVNGVSAQPVAPFEFRRGDFGAAPQMQFDKAKSSFDYTFQVLKQGRFAEDNAIPDGLIYQVQIFSKASGEAAESDLKGLSPVFSRKDKAGKTVYYAGLFSRYADCLDALGKARRAGFKSAVAVAFRDGETIAVNTARNLEKNLVQSYRIRIRPDGGRLSESALSLIGAATAKDLVRDSADGATTYLVGNFSDADEVLTVLSAIRASGLSAVLENVTE